jgi:hypothetical protein
VPSNKWTQARIREEIRVLCAATVFEKFRISVKPEESNFAHSSPGQRWLALACVLLLVTLVGAQVLHSHADGLASDGKACPICQVAHSAVAVVSIMQLPVAIHATGYLFAPVSMDRKSPWDSTPLFSRPPPVSV